MRAFQLRHLLSSPRRRWQLLLLGLTLLVLHLATSMLYTSHKTTGIQFGKSGNKELLDILHLVEAKTVSYNEVLDHEVLEGSFTQDTSPTSTTNHADEVVNKAFSFLDNPWYNEHDHGNTDDPLDLSPEDFELDDVDQCPFRQLKNVTLFSRAEFVHDYLNFRKCQQGQHHTLSPLDHWVRSHVKATAGSRGEMVIKTTFQFRDAHIQCHEAKLLIVAFSQSIKERDVIRATWSQNTTKRAQLVFMVGQSTEEASDRHSSDMLQTQIDSQDPDFEFKQTLAMYGWLYDRCPRVRFVLKTTSDIFLNLAKVDQLVEQEMFAANRMYGELLKRMQPNRDPQDTYGHFVSPHDWPWDHFPPFLKGPSYIVSGDLIPRILMATSVIPTLPLPQVFFTGLVPLMGHMMRIGVSSFFAYYPPDKDTTDPCDVSKFGGIHHMAGDLELMEIAMNKVEEAAVRNITCEAGPRCLAMVEGKCMWFSRDEKKKRKKPAQKWAKRKRK